MSETEIIKKNLVNKAIKKLQTKKLLKKVFLILQKVSHLKTGKKLKGLFSNLQNLGMTQIELFKKNDGSWTYFANDVAYHSDKVSDNLIN